jgi:hypothetical protein
MAFLRTVARALTGVAAWGRLLLVITPLTVGLAPGQAQVSRESDVKAVFLLNFAQFVEWPLDAFQDSDAPFVIGILGSDPFENTLDQIVQKERVRSRPVSVEHYRRVDEATSCHILFISPSETRRLPLILRALQGRPILTVSDVDGFARQGGMIRFVTENAKVRLLINNDAARAARLVISTKLLRLAEVLPSASAR